VRPVTTLYNYIDNRAAVEELVVDAVSAQIGLPRDPRTGPAGHRLPRARTEVTDWMLIFGQRHLRAFLAEYEARYNQRRPHRSRQLHPPRPDHPNAGLSPERIKRRPVLGGRVNEYERAA
jgi:hypothetical protein